jgi:hypothetical protein
MSQLHAQWQTLIAQPLAFVAAEQVRTSLANLAPAAQFHRLLQLPRFAPRLLDLLMLRRQLSPLGSLPIPDDRDLTVLLLTTERFTQLPRLCGAVWHASNLSREIRSEAVTQLRTALGAEVYAQALAYRHLAGAINLLREPEQLVEAIDLDGAACVNDWLQSQPAALRAWLTLRLPEFAEGPARLPKGADIVRVVASLLTGEQGEPTQ